MSKFEAGYDSQPCCPYCGLEYANAWELGLKDEDITQIECDCGKTYDVTCHVSVAYDSIPDCTLNKEEHVWEAKVYSGWKEHSVRRECSVCGKIVELVKEEDKK